jgi:peptidoglycan/LPS O-acetylase OafA/YrhL
MLHAAVGHLAATPTVAQRYSPTVNSFTAMRIVLAVMVLYGHDWAIVGSDNRDQLFRVTGGSFTMGILGVAVFFVLSGFLVTQSIATTRGPHRLLRYLWKRALRIWPALAVSVVVVVFGLGVLVTNRPLGGYFSFQGGWSPWWYTFDTVTFNVFSSLLGWHTRVRDLFAGQPMDASINGSLWTLRFEVAMYLILALVALVTRYRLRVFAGVTATVAVVGFLALLARIALPHPELWVLNDWGTFITLAIYFFLGSVIYAFRGVIPASGTVALVALVVALLTSVMSIGGAVAPFAISYAAIIIGLSPRLAWYEHRFGDYSYGTYIYAWPIQQTVEHFLAPRSPYVLFVVALPLTLLVAIGSWHLIEKPALRLKGATPGRRVAVG